MNLNEVWYYDDPTDRWAAEREFSLRERRYRVACEGALGVFRRASQAFRDFQEALVGLDVTQPLPKGEGHVRR